MKKITIAIASPGDVSEEREAVPKVFNRWNDDNPKLAFLHPKMWENATPEMGGHPQKILNRKLIDDSDLLVAIMLAASLRHGQDPSNSHEHGQLSFIPLIFRYISFRSRPLQSQNCPPSLPKPIFV